MSTIGILCPPLSGHLDPMLALGGALRLLGHRVVVFNVADAEERVRRHGLEFGVYGLAEFPAGSIVAWERRSLGFTRPESVREAAQLLVDLAKALLRDGLDLLRGHGVDALLVDQTDYASPSLADALGIPYVALSNALPLLVEPDVPFHASPWQPSPSRLLAWRDPLVSRIFELHFRLGPARWLNAWRATRGLATYRRYEDLWATSLAQLSQCPDAFDFPRRRPANWHGVGPLRVEATTCPFPFERLDGRPLAYVSLGSMQGGRRSVFAAIAKACAPLGLQLVISHGRKLSDEEVSGFAGNPIVVPYAPQRELIARSALVITHAGMNTVLDAISLAVPVVAIPILYEQPGIAARVAWHRVGEVVPVERVSVARLHRAVRRVLEDPRYRMSAQQLASTIAGAGGMDRAVGLIEQAFATQKPVLGSATTQPQRATAEYQLSG
jgi:MGT family glycosyltransferase